MIKKFNLALVPLSKQSQIIQLANQFSDIKDQYLLGKQSLPHITLYQFIFEESNIQALWDKVLDLQIKKSITFSFSKFSCTSRDKTIFWISLIPDQSDRLHELHRIIADVLELPIKSNFDPHMTLLNTKKSSYELRVDEVAGSYKIISDQFVLCLGLSDSVGQLIKIIYQI